MGMSYDVRVDAIVRVSCDDDNFDAAANLARGIIKGDLNKPDSARILDAWVKSVTVA